MSKKPETLFKERLQRQLDMIPRSFWIKVQQQTIRGTPDILGVVNGRMVALELKVGRNKADKLQVWTLQKIKQAGGFTAVVHPDNSGVILDELLNLLD